MSQDYVSTLRKKVKQIGTWMGVRYMRNQGLSLEQAYFVLFNRQPRI